MFTEHYDKFNDAINEHSANASAEEHESVLYHESRMYEFAKEYIRDLDSLTEREVDLCLRYMRWHITVILEYTGLNVLPDAVMYEMLDFQSSRLAA